MRLPKPFYNLPVRFDADRLCAEAMALPPEAWISHPDQVPGNSAVRLISANGLESDDVTGAMEATRWLEGAPYIRQVLASFGVVWSRSRLMRLAPFAGVPDHADINYNWHTRVRLHIPISTSEDVRFICDRESVHMAAGEAWIFDNWRRHRVDNGFAGERIHLVADTTGTSSFWRFACGPQPPRERWKYVPWQPNVEAWPLTEVDQRFAVMSAAEVQWLIADLDAELTSSDDSTSARERVARFRAITESFVCDWRQLCALHGLSGAGAAEFQTLSRTVHEALRRVSDGLVMRMNGVAALQVFEKRILNHLLNPQVSIRSTTRRERRLEKPVFIVAAPRSGSTLLFETLACSPSFSTLGDEAHWLIEDIDALRPGADGIRSNRLTGEHATDEIIATIRHSVLERLQGPDGRLPLEQAVFLEKTPKNSLRIPFLLEAFPDARFIFLWRDPRENLSSIMEAWRAGAWITYRSLPGWEGTWSMLLPPDWESLQGAPLEELAAWQWRSANEIAMADLNQLPKHRRSVVRYQDLLESPVTAIQRMCAELDVPFDEALNARVAGVLPHSRYTHTPPQREKWRRNEEAIARVLPGLDDCWRRLHAFS